MQLNVEDLNFERCEDEPIHIPESIQGYGYLFALDQNSGAIRIISENVKGLLGDTDKVLGLNFFDLLEGEVDEQFLRKTYQRAKARGTRLPVQIHFRKEILIKDSAPDYFAVIYESEERFVIELEPAGQFRESYIARHFIKMYATSVAPKFKSYKSLSTMASEIVDTIKEITGFDRVVLYKFNENATGRVIAEAKEADMDSYLDLLYPASDIPPQARELYKKNWVRLTPNVDLETSRLIPAVEDGNRKPLDMTNSLLRTLSPIHLQYVRNQGLKASLSMSLVTHDHLWGIISCHSRKPSYIPQNVRLECENLSQLFSWHLYAKEEELIIARKDKTDRAINNMLDKTSPVSPIVEVFTENEQEVLSITETDGFMFYTEEETIKLGTVPELPAIREIYEKVSRNGREPYISTDVSDQVSDVETLNGIRGVLLIPLLENKSYFTAWFRKEQLQVERWAGPPDEKSATGSKKERLMPRTSFKVHEKRITNQSLEWDSNDLDTANRFNKVFMAHALESQEQMRKSISKLEMQSQYKNEFLATLAHELRNPLTPLKLGISMLEDVEENGPQKMVVNTMKRQVQHMATLIDDLMDVSRITQGKVKLEKKNLCLQEVLKNAVETCQRDIDEKNHQLIMHLPEEPLWTYGDATRLSQVFVNIINNASKYTDPEGEISIEAKQVGHWISVTVKDNGIGIPEEKLDSIFTMFTQIDAYSTHTKGGLGIGLTLVQRLVNLHRGEIFARSEGAGKGSEFEVLLHVSRDNGAVVSKKKPSSEYTPSRQHKILIVDDNHDVMTMYEMLLRKEGYLTKTASNGRRAIEIFKEFKPDFALFDIGMPDMDGFELCRTLSSTPEATNTVFISQSGWGNKEKIEEARKAGFAEHLIKPLDREILTHTLRKYK